MVTRSKFCAGTRPIQRRSFSLIEAVLALALLAMVASVLLAAIDAAVMSTTQSVDELVASGIAQQVMDEAMGLPYVRKTQTTLDPNNVLSSTLGGAGNSGRSSWLDIDDYSGVEDADSKTLYSESPPLDGWQKPLGTGASSATAARHPKLVARSDYFDNWLLETEVYYVDPSDVMKRVSTPTYYRAFEVRVFRVQS